MSICGGCREIIPDSIFLTCGGCNQLYDLVCANVSKQQFYNTLTKDHRDAWRCVMCKSREPKTDNTNTPVRGVDLGVNVLRGGAVRSPLQLDMSIVEQSEPQHFLNDTPQNATIELNEFQAFVMEMRCFRDEMKEKLRANMEHLKRLGENLTALSCRVTDCESRMDKFGERLEKLEQRGFAVQSDKALSESIEQLKAELNERDQDLLLNDVEISCIPEQKGENLTQIVSILGRKLGVDLAENDLVRSTRVGRVIDATRPSSSPRPRPIVVRLARRAIRDQLLQAARVRRGTTTEGIDVPGAPRRFYINERLTKANRQLFRRARDLGGRLNWRFVWTRDGRIYARQHHGKDAPRHRLRTEDDLVRVFGQISISSVE